LIVPKAAFLVELEYFRIKDIEKRKITQNIIIPSKLFDFAVARIQAMINSLVVEHVIAALAHECTWLYIQFGFH
jgi:hypothetical protein